MTSAIVHPAALPAKADGTTRSIAAPVLRILVVDDHSIVRECLSLKIDAEPGMKVVGESATGQEGISAARRLRPDVILMDLVLPGMNGIDATRQILKELPQTAIIALSACHAPEHLYRALRAGVRGYVLKTAATTELKQAITAVTSGAQYISESLRASLGYPALGCGLAINPIEQLSAREHEVLQCVAGGLASAEIATRLSLSCKTVESYRSRIMLKLGVTSRSELIRAALRFELPEA